MDGTISGAFGNIMDVISQYYNVTGLSKIKESFDSLKNFLELFKIVYDIPNLIVAYLWGPLGVCVIIIVFAALINRFLGVVR